MKVIVSICLLFFCLTLSFAQTVPSTCIAPDSITAKYKNDADRLAVRKFYRNNLPEKDSIKIPDTHRDSVLKALIAVYNVVGIAERDSVINFFNIHTFPNPNLNQLIITADTNLFWVQQLKNGILPTGEVAVDTIINNYFLYMISYSQSSNHPWAFITFQSDSNYNISPLTDLFATIQGIYFAEAGGWGGDGNDITDSIHSTHIELIYSYGWMDCLSGCICRRYWKFEIDFNCVVSFTGSYINYPSFCNFPFTGIQSNQNPELISVNPNPFSDQIFVTGIVDGFNFVITDLLGQVMQKGKVTDERIESYEILKSGIYFLNLFNHSKTYTFKIFKQ